MRERYIENSEPTIREYLQDNENWRSFLDVTTPLVTGYLGDSSFPGICYLLQYEREGKVDRDIVYSLFVDVINRGNAREKLHSNITHDMEGPVDL